jgi:hypothetical protein
MVLPPFRFSLVLKKIVKPLQIPIVFVPSNTNLFVVATAKRMATHAKRIAPVLMWFTKECVSKTNSLY